MTNYVAAPNQPISNATLSAGDTLTLLAGGYGSNDLIGPGAIETVSGTAQNEVVSGTVISAGQQLTASMTVASGGLAESVHVIDGGSLVVFGTAIDTVVSGAVSLTNGGVTAVNPTSAIVMIGGTIDGITVGNGGIVAIDGTANGGTVQSGGAMDVFGQGNGVTVQSGGALNVALGKTYGTTLSGGTQTVYGAEGSTGSYASSTSVYAGGEEVLTNAGVDAGTVIFAGGRELVGSGSLASRVTIAGGTLEIGVGGSATLGFSDTGGVLEIDGLAAPSSPISGFAAGDAIVFATLPASMTASFSASGDIVRLIADGVTEQLDIAGASMLPLQLGTDAATGGEAIEVACFCAGTAIATQSGDVAVERIVPGDLVLTADGRAEPVVWVGRRSYAGRFLRGHPHLLPIRIRAGALGRHLPRRDLFVSPNHALMLDGVLVPAEALVGTPGISADPHRDRVDYHHIELARHDVILAEGAPAETFLDDCSRGMFQSSDGMPGEATAFCAPRMASGFELEAIRRRLAA